MKLWLTRYALTGGILEAECEVTSDFPTIAKVVGGTWGDLHHKPHWHETREEAVKQAEKMRLDKIKSLERSLAKMKRLHFE